MRNAIRATARSAVTTPIGIVRQVRDTKRAGTRSIAGAPKAPAVLGRLFNRRGPGIEIENNSCCGHSVGGGSRRQRRHRSVRNLHSAEATTNRAGQIVVESTSSGAANVSTASAGALRGPDSPTLAERFILAFRLPYAIGCILVGFVLFGVLDVAFTIYVQTSNLSKALAAALAPSSLLTDLLIAYAFYAPRYMRRRLVEAGRALSPLLPDREGEVRGIFSEVAAPRPQLIAWFLFLVALLVAVNAAAILGTGASPVGLF